MNDEKAMEIITPIGRLRVESKGKDADYPGVWVSLITPDGKDTVLSMTEYDPYNGVAVTRTYQPDADEPEWNYPHEWTRKLPCAENMPEELKPFAIKVRDVSKRDIVVWARNSQEAAEFTENEANAGNLQGDEFEGYECSVPEEISRSVADGYDALDVFVAGKD